MSGCIKSTTTNILLILCGIEPADIRRDKNILEFRNRVLSEEGHILDDLITHPLTNNRPKSRVPLLKRMHSLASDINGTSSPKSWATTTWRWRWQNLNCRLCQYISESSAKPPGYDLKRRQWVPLNRVRSGYGRYAIFMHRIGLSDNPNCICGEIQTHQHVLTCQTIGIRGDTKTVDEDFRMWLTDNVLDV